MIAFKFDILVELMNVDQVIFKNLKIWNLF